jgi:hypothetical protein
MLPPTSLEETLGDADMKAAILSNPKVLKYIVAMLRSDSFDGAVGRVEGWRVFARLMSRLMQDGDAYLNLISTLLM